MRARPRPMSTASASASCSSTRRTTSSPTRCSSRAPWTIRRSTCGGREALELSASAIILVHNHPSGDPTPSRADIDMTKLIVEAARPLGVVVHDHIVVGARARQLQGAAPERMRRIDHRPKVTPRQAGQPGQTAGKARHDKDEARQSPILGSGPAGYTAAIYAARDAQALADPRNSAGRTADDHDRTSRTIRALPTSSRAPGSWSRCRRRPSTSAPRR